MSKPKLPKFLHSSQGLTFIEVLIAAGMLVLVAGTATFFLNQRMVYLRQISAREQVMLTIQKYASMAASIRNSARLPGNTALNKCLSVGVSGELDCQNGVSKDLILYGPFQGKGGSGDSAVSGTASSPMRYNSNGAPCAVASVSCNLEIFTSFRAICPFTLPSLKPADFCDEAVVIEISYTVKQISPFLKTMAKSVSTSATDILGR